MRPVIVALSALLLFMGTVSCKENTKEVLNSGGEGLFQQGNYNGAIVHFKNALEKDPNYAEARFNLGLAYLETGKVDQAEREFQKLQLQNPHDARVSFQLARVANFQNKPAVAVPLLMDFLKEHPDDAAALEELAISATLSGDLKSAQEHLEKAVSLHPDRLSARLSLARTFMGQAMWDEAEGAIDNVLAKDPKNQSGLHLLAQLQARRKNPEGMLEAYGRRATAYPSDLFARYKEGSLLMDRGQGEQVRLSAENMIKEFPDKPEGHRLLGLWLAREGRYDEAAASLQKSISIQPDLETYYLLGLAFYYQGKLEMALNQFQTVLDYNPGFVQPLLMQAEIFLRQRRGSEAEAVADKLAQLSPEDFRGPAIKGDALLLQGRPQEAAAQYGKALELAPAHYGLLFRSGLLKLSLGDAGGEKELLKAVEVSPKAAEARLALHAHYMREGRGEEAGKILADGITGGKSDAVLYNALAKAALAGKDSAGAEAYFLKARQADPDYLQTYYNTAILKLSEGRQEAALEQYNLALGVAPGDARALVASAIVLEAMGQDSAAEERLEMARQTGDPGAPHMLAAFLQRHGKSDQALAVLEQELTARPGNLGLVAAKAKLHASRGEKDKAMVLYGQLEAADPLAGTMEKSRAFMAFGEFDKAEEAARQHIALAPGKAQSFLPLAWVLEARGDRAGAEEALRKGLTLEPGNARLWISLGELQARGREAAKALESFDKALSIAPANVDALTGKGWALQLQGREEDAVRAYQQALQVREDHVPALNNLAMILAENEATRSQAVTMATAAYTRAIGNALVMDTLGYALLRNNEPAKGLELLERAAALAPGNPVILFHKGLAQAELGNVPEAKASLEAALEKGEFEERGRAEELLKQLQSGS